MLEILMRTPNHQAINTGHKAFDRQTTAITTGNICGGTQTGAFIRPSYDLHCNSFTFQWGHLQDTDLKHFRNTAPHALRNEFLDIVKRLADQYNGVILYKFFHTSSVTKERVVHGYIVTTRGSVLTKSEPHYVLYTHQVRGGGKSAGILRTVAEYVGDPVPRNYPNQAFAFMLGHVQMWERQLAESEAGTIVIPAERRELVLKQLRSNVEEAKQEFADYQAVAKASPVPIGV